MPLKTLTTTHSFQLFADTAFEAENAASPIENACIVGRNLLRTLMMNGGEGYERLLTTQNLKAIFLAKDHLLLQGFRQAFQQGFHHLLQQLQTLPLNQEECDIAEFYIKHCLSFYPYAEPKAGDVVFLPRYLDNRWQNVAFKIQLIELTPAKGWHSLFVQPQDRVFAYGLIPIQSSANPILIFMGTTYPVAQGFMSTIHTDLEAFTHVGMKLYRHGREKLAHFVQQHPNTEVCGTSLGGAVALLLLEFGDELSRVDTLNAPGQYFGENPYDRWQELKSKPPVYIHCLRKDLISKFGRFNPDWIFVDIVPGENARARHNYFLAHGSCVSGQKDTTIHFLSAEEFQARMHYYNELLFVWIRALVFYSVIAPYYYGIRPGLYWLQTHLAPSFVAGLTEPLALIATFATMMLAATIPGMTWALAVSLTPLILALQQSLLQTISSALESNEEIILPKMRPALA